MAQATQRPERVLELPLPKLENMNGLSIDFGGSVVKIAYLSKEDWKDGKPVSGDLGKVRLISFAREEFDEGLEFLKTNCFMRRNSEDDKPLMYTTGVGTAQFGKRIEEVLKIRIDNRNEANCFQTTLGYFVDNLPLEDFCVPIPKQLSDRAREEVKTSIPFYQQLLENGMSKIEIKEDAMAMFDKTYNSASNLKPYLMMFAGSVFGSTLIKPSGNQAVVNMSQFGGRSFLALGCLLTGSKTYDEIMSLAEKGNNLKLDMLAKEMTKKTEESKVEGMYDAVGDMMPRPVMLWGHAVAKDLSEFRKEDIARTLLYTVCLTLVTTALDACVMSRTKHVFVSGSFVTHPLTQKIVMDEFEFRKWQTASFMDGVDPDYHMHILTNGSHFGAIGAFLESAN